MRRGAGSFTANFALGFQICRASPAPLFVFCHVDRVDMRYLLGGYVQVEICAAVAGQWCWWFDFTPLLRGSVQMVPLTPAALTTLPQTFTNSLFRPRVMCLRRILLSTGWRG